MQSLPNLPSTFRKVVVNHLSVQFRACTAITTCPIPTSLKPTELLIKNRYAGVNASDINFSNGSYKPGVKPPFDCGFEAVGEIVGAGEAALGGAKGLQLGSAVVTQSFGGFAEYQVVSIRNVKQAPGTEAEWMALDLSGTTAALALSHDGAPKAGEVALVTAAAGGTGQFAAQLLKHIYGCKVIGLCSTDTKKAFLSQKLGVDLAVNYKQENAAKVIRTAFPTGVNFVYESVGGAMMDLALDNLALKGRIITIGSISGYQSGASWSTAASSSASSPTSSGEGRTPIPSLLLTKSATMKGFFLPHYQKHADQEFQKLVQWTKDGKVKSFVDPKRFEGLEGVADAVEYLHRGENVGKVVVKLA